MLLDLFIIAVFIVMMVMQFRDYKKYMDTFEEQKKYFKNYEVLRIQKSKLISTYFFAVVCVLIGILVIFKPELTHDESPELYAIFGIGMGVFFACNTTLSINADAFYYNAEGFLHDNKFYRYKDVKKITGIDVRTLRHQVQLFSGEKFYISRQFAIKLDELVKETKGKK